MKLGRFAFGAASPRANRRLVVGRKRGNDRPALVERLESRTLLSSSAMTLETTSPATSESELVIPATSAGGAVTLLGNSITITSGENSPSLTNFTDFGGADSDGSAPVKHTYTIENNVAGTLTTTGADPVTISGTGASYFSVTKQPGASVADGGSTTFTITFTPKTTGVFTATVSIATSDAASPFTFEIRGIGTMTGAVTLLGNSIAITSGETTPATTNWTDYGATAADGSLPLTRTYTIENNADGTLTMIGSYPVTISGPGAAYFTVTTQPGTSVTQGSTATFTITFTPTTPGFENATVSIATSDPAGPFTFAIQGVGLTMTDVATGGLETYTTAPGSGTGAADNEILEIEYSGYLTDGTLFDSSENPGRTPFQFELGVGQVIPGWDQGLLGMQIGESRVLIIPSALAYGASGQGSIPANATLIFDTTLLNTISAQGMVGSNYLAIPDGDGSPSTTNGTSFGTVTSTPGTPIMQNFAISAPGGGLSSLLASSPISIQGSSAFTVTQMYINPSGTGGQFTVTYTPANNVSTAIVTVTNAISSSGNFTFTVQAQGPASDDGAAQYVASTDDITGFAYNPTNLTLTDSIEIVITGGPTPQTILANEPSPELQSEFGTQNHDFTYAMPVLSIGSHSVSIYAVDSSTSSTTLLATTTVTSQNDFFDDHYYLMEYPTVAAAVAAGKYSSGYQHYLEYGQYAGLSPSPYWDESYYLMENPAVAAAVKAHQVSSGFMQYCTTGQYENPPGLLYFNEAYYLANNSDVAAAVTAGYFSSGFEHFVLFGQYENRSPMLYFSAAVYSADNPGLGPYTGGETLSDLFEHFIIYGQYEGRVASDYYNEQVYLADNADVAAAVRAGAFPDGFQHWLIYGQYEGRTAV